MMWVVLYFAVGTHEPLPGFTTAPMSRVEAEHVCASTVATGVYCVIHTAPTPGGME